MKKVKKLENLYIMDGTYYYEKDGSFIKIISLSTQEIKNLLQKLNNSPLKNKILRSDERLELSLRSILEGYEKITNKYKEIECNYCDLTKSNWEILFRNYDIKSEYGISEIYFNNSKLFVSDTNDNEVSVKINYCPMCGRKL